jgi:hypothetical protein
MSGLKKQIPCAHCRKRCLIANVTLYQTYWHVPPSGCSDGDYWREGECQFVCHHCNYANRLLFDQKYDANKREYVSDKNDCFRWRYRQTFKNVVKAYGDKEKPTATHKWVNNYWIDSLEAPTSVV